MGWVHLLMPSPFSNVFDKCTYLFSHILFSLMGNSSPGAQVECVPHHMLFVIGDARDLTWGLLHAQHNSGWSFHYSGEYTVRMCLWLRPKSTPGNLSKPYSRSLTLQCIWVSIWQWDLISARQIGFYGLPLTTSGVLTPRRPGKRLAKGVKSSPCALTLANV